MCVKIQYYLIILNICNKYLLSYFTRLFVFVFEYAYKIRINKWSEITNQNLKKSKKLKSQQIP